MSPRLIPDPNLDGAPGAGSCKDSGKGRGRRPLILPGILLCLFGVASSNVSGSGYIGSEACAGCHQAETSAWQQSDHFRAMELPDEASVEADFSGTEASFHGVRYRFFRDGADYRVAITEPGSEEEIHRIDYTFGHWPLQQYLVRLEDGFIQALNVAWDSRGAGEGGQRWFHLQPDEDIVPDHPFHWKNHLQNWNARCADCHSTNVTRNYDAQRHAFDTTWSELTVGCESCHGPGAGHVERAGSGGYDSNDSGLTYRAPAPLQWGYDGDSAIASPSGAGSDHHVDMCGACHSLRTQLTDDAPNERAGHDFHDHNRLQLVSDRSYHRDGQIREEVYVLGSFLQSRMYQAGVTCTNCHEPHSGKLLAQGNALCAQCHQPAVYDAPSHHHHDSDSEGARCVSCHMPATTYMQVDDRRDHSFTIPRPGLSAETGVPNACTGCHVGRNDTWAMAALEDWGIEPAQHWAGLSAMAQDGDILVTRPLTDLLLQDDLPAMVQASLLQQLSPLVSRVGVETGVALLDSDSPLVRRAAVSVVSPLPPDLRFELLAALAEDPAKSVRLEVAASFVADYAALFPEQKAVLDPLLAEYREALLVSAEFPATQLNIAGLELGQRNLAAAEAAYRQALRIDPGYVPAYLNLADYYRSIGRDQEVGPLLETAIDIAPESGAANHSYGLYRVRQQDIEGALPWLAASVDAADAVPRFAYVHAVALDSSGRRGEAIDTLVAASERWTNQYDILLELVRLLELEGKTTELLPYLSSLSRIAPSSPDVRKLVERYAN